MTPLSRRIACLFIRALPHCVALNDEATITVVDPIFNYGSTNLLALAQHGAQRREARAARTLRHVAPERITPYR